MKIINNPSIYLKPIQNTKTSHLNSNPTNTTENAPTPGMKNFAYRDFNISFGARTPENFYAQDFNRDNMPISMKNYLFYDYAQRQNIPPEQMMHEVFKHLEGAKDFDEVKKLYPKEDLFDNLHSNTKKHRENILAEINIARELSTTPLLKDGTDNFGMYLLRKIYSEGKTLKEISKDFLEEDIADEYKGFITKPIDYSTTAAYGIKFPKQAFWHSFIATRDDYKKFFVTLPKNMVDPNRTSTSNSGGSYIPKDNSNVENTEHIPSKRKYNIQKYRKKQISDDIKTADGDSEVILKKVRKRFSKDDPEASFITKYWSPIMTLAAEKIHLSEEMKDFAQEEKDYGKTSDDKYLFTRFWKNNPALLEEFSKAVPETIELFEANYAGGGLIPINSDFEKITSKTENQKILDFVSPEFFELLDYSKEIEPIRNARYEQHEIEQQKWEQHFLDRYGEVKPEEVKQEVSVPEEATVQEPKELSNGEKFMREVKRKNAKIYIYKGIHGEEINMAVNLDEIFSDMLKDNVQFMPSRYASGYIKYMKENPRINNEDLLLSLSANEIRDQLEDGQIMPKEELAQILLNEEYKYYFSNINKTLSSSFAMTDAIIKNLPPEEQKDYAVLYRFMPEEYNELEAREGFESIVNILKNKKSQINTNYEKYQKPLSQNELNKITIAILNELSKYPQTEDSIGSPDVQLLTKMLYESIKNNDIRKRYFKTITLKFWLPENSFARFLLDKDMPPEIRQAKFEVMMTFLIKAMFKDGLLPIIGKDLMDKNINKFSPSIRENIKKAEERLGMQDRQLYNWNPQEKSGL